MNKIEELIIHHSASRRNVSVATIRKWHTDPKPQGNGWDDIGYHYIITANGKLHVGRPLPRTGAHAPPNSKRIGCCVTGDNTNPAHAWVEPQLVTLRQLVAAVRLLWPQIKVKGHRQVMRPGYTECPGLDIATVL